MKLIERLLQQMPESHNRQDEAETDESFAGAQAKNYQTTSDQLDEGNNDARGPQGPNRQECIGIWQEIFPGMLERAKLKDFVCTRHKEDPPAA